MKPLVVILREIGHLFYLVFMPCITIILLLIVSSIIERPKLFRAEFPDLIIRFLLIVWFCAFYIRLSRISKYSIYPNIKRSKSEVGPIEKYYLIGIGLFIGTVCGLITWWMIKMFVPIFGNLIYFVSVVNSLIIMIPIITHYWVLKL
jgi:hypothetical protein